MIEGEPRPDDLVEARAFEEVSGSEPDQDVAASTPVREPEPLPGEGTLWIRCRAYLAHQSLHRRDPETGAWRCYLCQPETDVLP